MENKAHKQRQQHIQQWVQRLFVKDKLAHAYLLVGQKGAGKRDMARLFAQSLYCRQRENGLPCQACIDCTRVANHNHPDVHWIAPQGQSVKIEQVRELQKEFSYRGVEEQKKLYVIEQVETMTTQAANGLLKFLEEPHPGTYALLLTEHKHRLLPTILSRCQEIAFPPPSPLEIKHALEESHPPGLASLASHISTDMEEANALCEANEFAEARTLVIQLVEEVEKVTTQAVFHIQDKWTNILKDREQLAVVLDLLLMWYKDLLYIQAGLTQKIVYIDQMDKLSTQALQLSKERLARNLTSILEAKKRLHANVNPQLLLEQMVIRLQEG
ncbi:DNA polymerase III subunit delta' [Caldalkalibacillus salinus]|uniref:DNA polymerase III subunit delta' n=1 Tax=Caldalkalibacillus salinus TaxID=2803787 RepID=UPI00192432B6|nr:DNA polymerase III subunit delta' [Caldalkalibacillus salinus]